MESTSIQNRIQQTSCQLLFFSLGMSYPGLVREMWRDIPGSKMSDLQSNAYYPNDPSDIEIIENFDAPFDLNGEFGTRIKGYFVPPETGSYIFFLSGAQAAELWLSSNDQEENLEKIISFSNGTLHNQWNRLAVYT